MLSTLAVAAFAVVWFALVVRRTAGQPLPGLVVAALPLALLFMVGPLTVAAWNMLQGMAVATEPRNAKSVVVGLISQMTTSLGFGGLGALFTVTGGLALQLWHSEGSETQEAPTTPRSAWLTMILYGAVLLVPFVAIETWIGHRLIEGYRDAIDPAFLTRASQASVSERSVWVYSYCMMVLTSGALLSALLTVLSLVNLEALARGGRVRRAAWTWAIVVIVLALAGWSVFRAQSGLRALQTVAITPQGGTFHG